MVIHSYQDAVMSKSELSPASHNITRGYMQDRLEMRKRKTEAYEMGHGFRFQIKEWEMGMIQVTFTRQTPWL